MFRRLFVPLDGSARAEKAIPVAARLAHAANGTVTLARILVPDSGSDEYGANVLVNETRLIQPDVVAEAKAYLDTVLERYDQELEGIHLVLETAPGTIPSTLLTLSDQEQSDLIVMCSRGDTWLKRWIFGSVAQATFRQSHLPVLVLNEHGTPLSLEGNPLRILIPLDGSELAETVLNPVFQLLSTIPTSAPHQIHLFQVVATPPATGGLRSAAYLTDSLQKEECQAAEVALKALAQRLSRSKPEAARCVITTSVTINPDVAGAIVKHARENMHEGAPAYDLIALATHGRTGFKRAILGSVTEHVFGATSLPLLVVRPASAEAEAKQHKSEHADRRQEERPQSWVGLL